MSVRDPDCVSELIECPKRVSAEIHTSELHRESEASYMSPDEQPTHDRRSGAADSINEAETLNYSLGSYRATGIYDCGYDNSELMQTLILIRDFLVALKTTDCNISFAIPNVSLTSLSTTPRVPGGLADRLISVIEENESLHNEIEALAELIKSKSEILEDLHGSSDHVSYNHVREIELQLHASECENRDLRFKLDNILIPKLEQVVFEESVSKTDSENLAEIVQMRQRELLILNQQLEERNRIRNQIEQSLIEKNKLISSMDETPPLPIPPTLPPQQSSSPFLDDVHSAVSKTELAYRTSLKRLRDIQNQIRNLKRTISVKTENVLKPILDRIVSVEIEAKRLDSNNSLFDKRLKYLTERRQRNESRIKALGKEQTELEKSLADSKSNLEELELKVADLERIFSQQNQVIKSRSKQVAIEKTNYQKCMWERKNIQEVFADRVNRLKMNIVEISSLKERIARNQEKREIARSVLQKLVEEKFQIESQKRRMDCDIESSSRELGHVTISLREKEVEFSNMEESVRRRRIQVISVRRDLDLAKLTIAKYRGIGTRLAEAKSNHELVVVERKSREDELQKLIAANNLNPSPNIGEIFVLTSDSIADRIRVTEERLVVAHERVLSHRNKIRELDDRANELDEKFRQNIDLMNKISKFKVMYFELKKQVTGRIAEIRVYRTAIAEKLEMEKFGGPSNFPKRKIYAEKQLKPTTTTTELAEDEHDSDTDWLGVFVR